MNWIGIAAVIVAAGAGGLAWQKHQALSDAERDLTGASAQVQRLQHELRAARADNTVLRKETSELKIGLDQARAGERAARDFLDTERLMTARLREELAVRTGGRFRPADLAPPKPMAVRVAPANLPTAVGAPAAASAPAAAR